MRHPLLLFLFLPGILLSQTSYQSKWQNLPEMRWTGEDLWANRLQDWRATNGGVECTFSGPNRSLALLTHEIQDDSKGFVIASSIKLRNMEAGLIGFKLASRGPNPEYRSAAVYGKGISVGISTKGELQIGDLKSMPILNGKVLQDGIGLQVVVQPINEQVNRLLLQVFNLEGNLITDVQSNFPKGELNGGLALLSHFEQNKATASVLFDQWQVTGQGLAFHEDRTYGPIYFVKYTLGEGKLKLAAQCAPTNLPGDSTNLYIFKNGKWNWVQKAAIDPLSRTSLFQIDNWKEKRDIPYLVEYFLTPEQGYSYQGIIKAEPDPLEEVKLGLFSCNQDHGFPDTDLRENILKHQIDAALFLGDQFYEGFGGFGVDKSSLENSTLDYLRKWLMFGWSYRDVFREVPMISIPDDHDVYHGNVWGEEGEATPKGLTGYAEQDAGGYKMPPEWVKMVQDTQTGHLPDAYDPTPVKQNIPVYYTSWNWGPLSFAILEDRKFKSAPKNIFPEEAAVANGFITNPNFKIGKFNSPTNGQLWGERQEKFVDEWAANWSANTQFKVVLSQTNLATLATLPKGSTGDQMVPSLEIPSPGTYISGDAPTLDMDSNGWPHNKRNEAVKLLRKGYALQLAGDQHLASVLQYGVEEHADGAYAFAGPALNNTWPRRWWPELPEGHSPLDPTRPYTGNFKDGFENLITVHAVANPVKTGLKPEIIHNRATGYGMVIFDPTKQEITMECWPRYAKIGDAYAKQFEGWPVKISLEDNYGKKAYAFSKALISEVKDPVVQLINLRTEEIVYTRRFKGNELNLKVFEKGKYEARMGDSSNSLNQIERFKVK